MRLCVGKSSLFNTEFFSPSLFPRPKCKSVSTLSETLSSFLCPSFRALVTSIYDHLIALVASLTTFLKLSILNLD